MNRKGISTLAVLVTAWAGASALHAGVVLQIEHHDLVNGEQTRQTMQIDGHRMRIDYPGVEGETSMLFDGNRQALLYINHADRSYVEMTAESMKRMVSGMSAAMEQMEQQMANMPPEQRRQMEEMMKRQGLGGPGAAKRPPIEVRKTSETQTLEGHKCRRYDLYHGAQKEGEAWVADWASVGLEKDTFAGMEDLRGMFEQLWQVMPAGVGEANPFEAFDKLPGFPLLMRHSKGDRVLREAKVRGIDQQPMDAARFSPPAGYRQEKPFGQ